MSAATWQPPGLIIRLDHLDGAEHEYERDGGFIDLVAVDSLGRGRVEDANEADISGLRLALRWTPTPALSITPSYFFQEVEANDRTYLAFNESETRDELVNFNTVFPKPQLNRFQIASVEAAYNLGWAEALSVTTFYDLDFEATNEWTGFVSNSVSGELAADFGETFDGLLPSPNFNRGGEEQFIQEVRLTTDLEEFPVNFILGGFYKDTEHNYLQDTFSQAVLDDPLASQTSIATNFGGNIFLKTDEVEKLEEVAVYGHAFWDVTEALELQAGLRWFEYDRERFVPTSSGLFGFPTRATEASSSDVTPAFSATYEVSEEINVYARAAKGFRPGFGFATSFPPTVCDADLAALGINDPSEVFGQVEPDTLWNYEAGVKTTLFNNRFTFNASAYHIDWQDVQVALQLPTCAFRLDQNAGSATVEGFEVDFTLLPVNNLTLQGSLGHVDAKLAEDVQGIGQEGDRLPVTSEWNLFGAAQYDFAVTDTVDGFVRLNASYTSDADWSFAPTSRTQRKPELTLVDLRFGLERGGLRGELFVENAFNDVELGYGCSFSGFNSAVPGDLATCPNRPREIGFRIQQEF